jgi:hypothetical protein
MTKSKGQKHARCAESARSTRVPLTGAVRLAHFSSYGSDTEMASQSAEKPDNDQIEKSGTRIRLAIRALTLFRHSSFGFRHCPRSSFLRASSFGFRHSALRALSPRFFANARMVFAQERVGDDKQNHLAKNKQFRSPFAHEAHEKTRKFQRYRSADLRKKSSLPSFPSVRKKVGRSRGHRPGLQLITSRQSLPFAQGYCGQAGNQALTAGDAESAEVSAWLLVSP